MSQKKRAPNGAVKNKLLLGVRISICFPLLFLKYHITVDRDNEKNPHFYKPNFKKNVLKVTHLGCITDKIQIGTNIFLFLLQVYNVNLKTSFIKTHKKSFAVGCKLHNFNMDVAGVETKFTSFSPYAAFSTKVSRNTFLHMGGQYSFFSGPKKIEDATAGATSSGTSIALGIEHSVSHKTKFLFENGYDFTFKGIRIGGAVHFAWKKFRLKLGVNFFKPKGTNGYVLPVISLWWRFQG